ncbi:MAG: glycerophosphodiester phosphodiesterase [Nocardioidaceae bacterium]
MTFISAHRCGAGKHSTDAEVARMLAHVDDVAGEYVEFDVQVTRDQGLVVMHDASVVLDGRRRPVSDLTVDELRASVPHLTTYEEALVLIAGKRKAHIDVKFGPRAHAALPPRAEIVVAQRAVEVLGADNVILTTGEDELVAAMTGWAKACHQDLLVGLTLGGTRFGLSPWRQARWLWSEVFPAARVRRSNANAVAVSSWLARLRLARWAAGHDIPLLVWTVDGSRGLSRWLSDPGVWMVATNVPARAAAIRSRLTGGHPHRVADS